LFSVFYNNRFTKCDDLKVKLDNVAFSRISRKDNDVLVSRLSKEEIRTTLWDCDSNKSIVPNGFNFKFFKQLWDLIKMIF